MIEDADDAAAWITRLATQERGAEPGPASIGPKPDEPDRLAEQIVGWLPGVSSVGARRLLEHFGSLRALFAADAERIMEVRGFGPRRSQAIAAIGAHVYGGAGGDDDPREPQASRPRRPPRRARRPAAGRARGVPARR